jgi:hypothetical protein
MQDRLFQPDPAPRKPRAHTPEETAVANHHIAKARGLLSRGQFGSYLDEAVGASDEGQLPALANQRMRAGHV